MILRRNDSFFSARWLRRPPRRISNHRRHKSTVSRNPYPYPNIAHPTPHQIFHLPRRASPEEVKTRYYELVRIYHPDTSVSHALKDPPDIAQARFHAITAAYDNLRSKCPSASAADESLGDVTLRNSEAAMVKARMAARARQAEFLESGGDERWKEWIFMGAIMLTAIAFVAQNFWTRRKLLAEVKSRQLSDHPTQ